MEKEIIPCICIGCGVVTASSGAPRIPPFPTELLRYMGSLPPPVGKDIIPPLPQKDNEDLLVLFARKNESLASNAVTIPVFRCLMTPEANLNRPLRTILLCVFTEMQTEIFISPFATTNISAIVERRLLRERKKLLF